VDLADLERHFGARISTAKDCLALTDGDPAATAAVLDAVAIEAAKLKSDLAAAKDVLAKWRLQLSRARRLVDFLRAFNGDVDQVDSAMTAQPRLAAVLDQRPSPEEGQVSQTDKSQPEQSKSAPVEAKKAPPSRPKPFSVHKIDFLTVQEFDSLPKYMKGRLKYEALNAAVDEFNAALADKYTFLARGFLPKMSIEEKKRFKDYKAQESTREARGAQFLTADDLRSASCLKLEANRRAIFTILRHCGRVREIRKAGELLRYASTAVVS